MRKTRCCCFLVFVLAMAGGCGGDSTPGGIGDAGRDAAVEGGASGGDSGTGGVGGQGGAAMSCAAQPIAGGELGGQCRGAQGICAGQLGCLAETSEPIGGMDDPITAYPPGDTVEIPSSLFPGDYCTFLFASDDQQCTQGESDACAAECGVCVPFYINANVCFRQCVATGTDNGACRDDYACDLVQEVCVTGCQSDDECRITREDTNSDGMIGAGDALVYDPSSNATCNPTTFSCEHPGTPGAEAGIACDNDEQCEAKGDCLGEAFGFEGGYCTKFRCDLQGNGCAGDGVCVIGPGGLPLCLEPCKIGTGVTAGTPSTYLNNTQGCRTGYSCTWDGANGVDAPANGVCFPGNFNAVTVPNIGDACTMDDECYSPLGQGACEPAFDCTVIDCAAPGVPADVCGDGNACLVAPTGNSFCVRDCTTNADCSAGRVCVDPDEDPMTPGDVCLPCIADEECDTGQTCDTSSGIGVCQ